MLKRVDELVMSDLTPEALQNRMRRGDMYPLERVERALGNFFRPGNPIALRGLALRQLAHAVDRNLETYLNKQESRQNLGVRERIGVCISSNPAAQHLIARGARMAQAMDGELYVIYVDVGQDTAEHDQKTLRANILFAENVGAIVVRVKGTPVAEAVAEVIRESHLTRVVFGRSATRSWRRYLYFSAIHRFLRDSPSVDVHIVTQEPA